ncbi:MAG: hypothetical protein KDE01_07435, partial [Caldilineaceae bacterium]|nr:hypothetical protein [Caldilineaceae bacterium]
MGLIEGWYTGKMNLRQPYPSRSLSEMKQYKNYLMDMDGVLVRGKTAIAGAQRFIDALNDGGHKYLVLTNNPMYTPRDLAHRLQTTGLQVASDRIFTSAIATARFMQ